MLTINLKSLIAPLAPGNITYVYVSLPGQNTTRKWRVDENVGQMEFDTGDDKSGEYEVEAIWDSAVYVKESEGIILTS